MVSDLWPRAENSSALAVILGVYRGALFQTSLKWRKNQIRANVQNLPLEGAPNFAQKFRSKEEMKWAQLSTVGTHVSAFPGE